MKEPRVITLGCRLNSAESEVMQALAKQQGLDDAIIINTCAVTAEAERQARQTIRRLRKENPDAYIIATGCAVQLRPDVFSEMPELNRVIGNSVKQDKNSFSKDFPYKAYVEPMSMVPENTEFHLPLIHGPHKAKAFLEIQNGCNHRCTFCTIPLARGKSRSIPIHTVIQQAKHLVKNGVKELVLTGVDLTSYWDNGGLDCLLKGVLDQIPDLSRIRLSSLDCIEINPPLLDLFVHEARLLPHLHISLQSGSDAILKSMRRRHSCQQALDLCGYIREKRPETALGADFIAGFPGETDAMFQETLDFVKNCHLTHLHVFPFSKRPGTVAARMPDQLTTATIKERASQLRDVGKMQLSNWLGRQVGQQITLLTEKPSQGHADDFSTVHLTTEMPVNEIVTARVLSCVIQGTSGHLVAQPL